MNEDETKKVIKGWLPDDSIEEMFADLDRKMAKDWRLRWHYRWEKLKLDISEWWHGLLHRNTGEY